MSIDHRTSDGHIRPVGEAAENWLAENQAALDSSNAWVQARGLPLDPIWARHNELQLHVEQGARDVGSLVAIPDDMARAATLTFPQDAFGAPEER